MFIKVHQRKTIELSKHSPSFSFSFVFQEEKQDLPCWLLNSLKGGNSIMSFVDYLLFSLLLKTWKVSFWVAIEFHVALEFVKIFASTE